MKCAGPIEELEREGRCVASLHDESRRVTGSPGRRVFRVKTTIPRGLDNDHNNERAMRLAQDMVSRDVCSSNIFNILHVG